MKYFYLSIIIFSSLTGTAQCLEQFVSLQQVASDADLIIEGEVISQTYRKNDEDTVIKTVNTVQVSRLFKGTVSGNTIDIITLGGVLNGEFNLLTHAVKLEKAQKGIFFLDLSQTGDRMFAHGNQGLVEYSQSIYAASRGETRYSDIQGELYRQIEQATGQLAVVISSLDFRFAPASNQGLRTNSIMSLSTTFSAAGVRQSLVISGSGFGASRGSGSVDFANADNGGAGRIALLDTQYVSWSDSQIEVIIRSGAGTGQVNVVTDSGSTFTSSETLTIAFNHTNFPITDGGMDYGVQIRLANDNGNNGYTWNYATNLTSNNDAELTVDDSFEQWRCTTGRNFVLGADLASGDAANTSNASNSDTVNVVKFDTGEIPASSGTLGFLSIKGFICGSAPNFIAYASELDFVFNSDTNFHYRDTATESLDSNEFDFRSVANHELGHAQLLGHVIDTGQVMHFAIGPNTERRDISEFDQRGAETINQLSLNDPASCSPGAMALLSCSYVYENGGWSPFDPSGTSNRESTVEVRNGSASIIDDLQVRDITTDAGATLSAPQGNYRVEIFGDIVNNGILDFDRLSMESRERAQVISGNPITTGFLFVDCIDLSLNTQLNVEDGLGVSGILNTNGNLRLVSSASEDAIFGPFMTSPFTAINGDVITERFYPANRAFRFISSSVNTTTSIFDNWQNGGTFTAGIGTHITGGTAANGFDQTTTNNSSLFTFTNASPQSWDAVSSTNNPTADNLQAGTPYRIFVRGDRTPTLLTDANAENNTKLQTTGTLQVGPVTFSNINQNQDAFSFIGNPLHAPIDMEAVLTRTGSNVTPTYYIWDPQAADVGKYVAVNTLSNTNDDPMNSAANKFAQVQQAFFVQTQINGPASLTFEESDKANAVNTAVNSVPSRAHIYAALYEQQAFQNGGNRLDGFNLSFDPSYNSGVDDLDSRKLRNVSESISTLENGQQLAIQQRVMPVDSDVIGLFNENYLRTNYTYEFEVMGISGVDVFFIDTYLNTSTKLDADARTAVSFTVDPSDPGSIDPLRFNLEFSDATLSVVSSEIADFNIYPNPTTGEFFIELLSADEVSMKIYSLSGQLVQQQDLDRRINRVQHNLKSGIYLVDLTIDGQRSTKKLIVQ